MDAAETKGAFGLAKRNLEYFKIAEENLAEIERLPMNSALRHRCEKLALMSICSVLGIHECKEPSRERYEAAKYLFERYKALGGQKWIEYLSINATLNSRTLPRTIRWRDTTGTGGRDYGALGITLIANNSAVRIERGVNKGNEFELATVPWNQYGKY